MSNWHTFSKKLYDRILRPRNLGRLTVEEAEWRDLFFVHVETGSLEKGNRLAFFWLVDPTQGVIVDATFQVFGPPALVGVADLACDVVLGKNYDQVRRIDLSWLEQQLRDRPQQESMSTDTIASVQCVVDGLQASAEKCSSLPLPTRYVVSPVPSLEGGGIPNWSELSQEQKIAAIEAIISVDILPYVALDGGGLSIVSLSTDDELVIAYEGACTSCASSVGGTLQGIQDILQSKTHPNLRVRPDLSRLSFPEWQTPSP